MRTSFTTATSLGLVLMLSACGGGGGGGVNSPSSAPPPSNPNPATTSTTPTPPSTPAPPPAPKTEDAPEYRASGALVASNAAYAYDKGITGKGVTIAVIDTGIATGNSEFAGRISPDSKSFDVQIARCMTCAPETVSFDLADVQGHGTETASVAAAAKDGKGVQGVAYEATILALKIAAPDMNGVTTTSTAPIKEGDGGNVAAVAPAIAYGADKGAFVYTMSLNGGVSGTVAQDLRKAMDLVRSKNLLFVESVSNFNNDDSFKGQIAESMVGTDLANKDWFLFGIRVDSNLRAPTGNGLPGALADRTLAVVASDVQVTTKDGTVSTVTGNSFAAPAIAGAAALLKQYWPQLGGKEISRILLDTATDLGAPGVDQVYGAGLLNIAKAMQAQAPALGTSSLHTSSVESSSITFSGAFGGADAAATFSSKAGEAVVLDKYGRDYKMNVGHLASSYATRGGVLLGGMMQPEPTLWAPSPANQAAALVGGRAGETRTAQMPRNGRFGFRVSADTAVVGQVNGSIEHSGLVTGSMLSSLGFATQGADVTVMNGGYSYGFSMASSKGRTTHGMASTTTGFTMSTPKGFTFGLSSNMETGSALGMRGTGAFAISGSTSTFVTLGWSGSVAGFRLAGEAMGGRTSVRGRSDMVRFGSILSSGFRFQADHSAFGGVASLGMTSPLRVERATLHYTSPVAFDQATHELINETRSFGLAPEAREMNLELGWARSFGASNLSIGGAYGMNSGNIRGANSAGAWLRFGTRF